MEVDIRAAKNAYAREWRARNKEKVKASQERYWQKKAEELAALKHQEENKRKAKELVEKRINLMNSKLFI